MSFSIIPGSYLTDLLQQPDALRAACTALAGTDLPSAVGVKLRSGEWRRVVLTGMGSSLHALYPLHLALGAAGMASHWMETSELLLGFPSLYAPDTLLIAVSQSGESAEIVALARRVHEFGHVICVTNRPDSTLGRIAHFVLPLHAGLETTVSCKTYVNTLAVLHWLAAALTGRDAPAAVRELVVVEPWVRDYLARSHAWVEALKETVARLHTVFVTGRGGSMATAGTGGLILKESTRQPAEGMSCAAFRHGPFEMIGDQVLVLVCEGDARVAPLHRRLVADIVRLGGRAELIAGEAASGVFRLPKVPVPLLPLVEILPVQMLSLALAARDGREAGRFERATKITTAA